MSLSGSTSQSDPQRAKLQSSSSLAELRESLRHWQDLELDYHGLKDEFSVLGSSASSAECFEAARASQPVIVDERELRELIGPGGGRVRPPQEIVEVLEKRIEYVSRNVGVLGKQIGVAERRLREAESAAADSQTDDQETEEVGAGMLPVSEIIEELDEDDNVISGMVSVPGEGIARALQSRGQSGTAVLEEKATSRPRRIDKVARIASTDAESQEIPADANPAEILAIIDAASKDHADSPLSSPLLGPINQTDTAEEARLRQEMLQYNLDDVSNIVAELEIAEGETMDASDVDLLSDDLEDFEDDEDGSFEYHDESSEDNSEDERGMSTRPLSDEYKHRMQALEKELATKMKNVGPVETIAEELKDYIVKPPAAEAARQAAIKRYDEAMVKKDVGRDTSMVPAKKSKKKVAFSRQIDIVSEKPANVEKVTDGAGTSSGSVVDRSSPPTGDIVERDMTTASTATPVRTSRFKAARRSTPQTPLVPPPMDFPVHKKSPSTGPAGKLVADTLIERPSSKRSSAPDPDDFDEELQKRQIALEHHAIRNKMIHEQGGYVRGGELDNFGDEYVAPEILDENTGQPRKVSRFKATRMQR